MKPILRFDLGHVSMKEKIHIKKLTFLYHLKNLQSGSLASEIFDLQVKYNFPGLITECRNLLKLYNLPDIVNSSPDLTKNQWKTRVKKHVKEKSAKMIKNELLSYSKLKKLGYDDDENLECKEYTRTMSLKDARTQFRIRSQMIDVKMNQKSNEKYARELWKCDFCMSIDSQAHIMWCPAFSPLREGRNLQNDLDLVHYFQEVMKIRENSKQFDL